MPELPVVPNTLAPLLIAGFTQGLVLAGVFAVSFFSAFGLIAGSWSAVRWLRRRRPLPPYTGGPWGDL